MPSPHLFIRKPRPAWHFFAIGSILGLALLAGLEYAQPWNFDNECNSISYRTPTPAQHAAAVADGWIPGTDGYIRFIYGPDAY